jgi:hypothetical protein
MSGRELPISTSTRFTPGRIRRICPSCDLEVEVAKPNLPLAADTPRNGRKVYSEAIRGQICWPALCADCTVWWNRIIRKISGQEPEHQQERTAA